MLSGRQGLHLIYAYFVTDQQASAVHNLEDLLSVTLRGDQKVESFMKNWDVALIGMDEIPSEDTLYTLFFTVPGFVLVFKNLRGGRGDFLGAGDGEGAGGVQEAVPGGGAGRC